MQSIDLPGTAASAGQRTSSEARIRPGTDRSAAAAVAAYLRARVRVDGAASYALLTPASKKRFPAESSWVDALPDLPAPRTFSITAAEPAGAGVDVSVDVRRTPALDSFVGLVPGRALEVYRAERSGSGWRVDALPVRTTLELASDRTAAADVQGWLDRVAACDGKAAAARQVGSDLLGDDSLPGAICSAHSALRAGHVRAMVGVPATAPFLAAYGPDLGGWARLVPVSGPDSTFLVGVAPLGSSWRVFGIVSGGIH